MASPAYSSRSNVDRSPATSLELDSRLQAPISNGAADRDAIPASAAEALTEVPDGGYGWKVVAGCATLQFWFGGTTYSWGVMQAALAAQGLSSPSILALIGQ